MSLRRRLFLFVFVPVAILYYAFGIYGVYQTRSQLVDDLDADLRSTSTAAAALLDALSTEQITELVTQPGGDSPQLTAIVDVASGDVQIQPASLNGEAMTPPSDNAFQPGALARRLDEPFTVSSRDGSLEYRAVATRLDGGRLFVRAQSLERIDALTRRFLVGTLITGLMILSAMAAVVYVAIRSGLRPLRTFIETTVRVAEGDLTERVETEQADPAFSQIARATNHMLDEVELSYEKERVGRQRLNELVADAAHELRTPLTAIRGTIEMRSMGVLDTDDKLRTAFRGIDEHSERMVGIVEDLIVIARAENMRLGVQTQTTSIVDLHSLLPARIAVFTRKNPERRVGFDATEGTHEIAADDALLRIAIDQILENTAIHTPETTDVQIRLSGDADHTRLTFTDTGPGVPVDITDRVFDRFVRGDSSRARSTGGAGLGLSIVQSIVEAADGEIALASNSADGCSFEVTFPRFRRTTGSD